MLSPFSAPVGLGSEVGYVGLIAPPFSDQGFRVTNLYWRQNIADRRFVVFAGFLDATDYVDVYALASPWLGFSNLVFSTGSAAIPLPNDAAFGAAVGGWLNDNLYVIGGLTDSNADPTSPFDGFDTFFSDFETFKSVELGWARSKDELLLYKVHATLWHVDAREAAGTPEGYGINFSALAWLEEKWLPFLRGGWTHDGGSLLEGSVSAGIWSAPRMGTMSSRGIVQNTPSPSSPGPVGA